MSKFVEKLMEFNSRGFNITFKGNIWSQHDEKFRVTVDRVGHNDSGVMVQESYEVDYKLLSEEYVIPRENVVMTIMQDLVEKVRKLEQTL